MNCYKCKKIIDRIHDKSVDNNELQSVLHHIQGCESCSKYYTVMDEMLKDLSSFEERPLPEGFHNRLHFALKRESEKPAKSKKPIIRTLKIAAAGAFSVLLVMAAVSLLPKAKFESMQNVAMDEAVEESMDMVQPEAAMQEVPKEFSAAMEADNSDEDGTNRDAEGTTEAEATLMETASDMPEEGESIVLMLDVDDPNQTYDELLELIPDPLPETPWVIDGVEEPEIYRQIRKAAGLEEINNIALQISARYSENIVLYYVDDIEYDNYDEELADLQNAGYIFVLIK